jgi:hypothetical protein
VMRMRRTTQNFRDGEEIRDLALDKPRTRYYNVTLGILSNSLEYTLENLLESI